MVGVAAGGGYFVSGAGGGWEQGWNEGSGMCVASGNLGRDGWLGAFSLTLALSRWERVWRSCRLGGVMRGVKEQGWRENQVSRW